MSREVRALNVHCPVAVGATGWLTGVNMIGTVAEAILIRDWQINKGGDWVHESSAPEGWSHMGTGCYRIAFLSPSGVVYKVQRWYNNQCGQTNSEEWENHRKYFLRKHPEGCKLPRMQYFALDGRGVIAMERYKTTLRRSGKLADPRVQSLRSFYFDLYDLHSDNIGITENGEVGVIDFGG